MTIPQQYINLGANEPDALARILGMLTVEVAIKSLWRGATSGRGTP